MWYLYASRIERLHPMNCGFWSVRRRTDRRSGLPQEALLPFWWGQFKTIAIRLWRIAGLFFQLEEVWLRSRPTSELEEALEESIAKTRQGMDDWRDLKAKELVAVYERLHVDMPQVKVPSRRDALGSEAESRSSKEAQEAMHKVSGIDGTAMRGIR